MLPEQKKVLPEQMLNSLKTEGSAEKVKERTNVERMMLELMVTMMKMMTMFASSHLS